MAEKTYTVEFNGYRRETHIKTLPTYGGIYCVYEGKLNKGKQGKKDTVTLYKLIYIGETDEKDDGIRDRINEPHEKWNDWKKHVGEGNLLYFSYAEFPNDNDRKRVECALIFEHKPLENTECKDSFPYDKTTISLTGEIAKLHKDFTVERTE